MGDPAGQLAHGFHFLRAVQGLFGLAVTLDLVGDARLQRFVQPPQLVFGAFAVRDLTL